MDPNPLIERLEKMPHGERIKTMVLLGRESISSSDARSAIQNLESQQGFFGKFLALQSVLGSRNVGKAKECLNSTSSNLRSAAAIVLVSIGTNQDLVQVRALLIFIPGSVLGVPCSRVKPETLLSCALYWDFICESAD